MEIRAIYEQWHEYARTGNVDALVELYAEDATFESPLVPVLTDAELHICRGHNEIRRFLDQGVQRRPNELVRWYRTGEFLTNGTTLVWEYPRATPDGQQIDICEVMEINDGKIAAHRIYWGWFGCSVLAASGRAQRSLRQLVDPASASTGE